MQYNNNFKNNSRMGTIFNIVIGFLFFDDISLTFVSSLTLMRVYVANEEDVMTAFGGELGEDDENDENDVKVEVDLEIYDDQYDDEDEIYDVYDDYYDDDDEYYDDYEDEDIDDVIS